MDNSLQDMEPKLLWKHFLRLSEIPRGSGNERAAACYVAEEARNMGHDVISDEVGNLVIRKNATPGKEKSPGVILQAHLDMVCEKNETTRHDFLRDPLSLYRQGDLLRARGTTLGADNGIGVAAALALLETPELRHGPLEILITMDEETGLTGAGAFKGGILHGKYFLNLDSEDEGILTIGCAGGIDTVVTLSTDLKTTPAGRQPLRLKLSGLKGGHSGIDINRGRGNSICLMARLLYRLIPAFGADLASIDGGNKRNAIPREAFAVILVEPSQAAALNEAVSSLAEELRRAFGAFEPDLALSLEQTALPEKVLSAQSAKTIVDFLYTAPCGVIAMSPDLPGLVQTSTNLGIVATRGGSIEVNFLSRSSIDSCKSSLAERIAALAAMAGMECSHSGSYPGWQPQPDTYLVKSVTGLYQRLYGQPMKIEALHAGLECGIIGEKYPDMEMVSIGPDMWDVHTPEEKVSISSAARFLDFIEAIVESL